MLDVFMQLKQNKNRTFIDF